MKATESVNYFFFPDHNEVILFLHWKCFISLNNYSLKLQEHEIGGFVVLRTDYFELVLSEERF